MFNKVIIVGNLTRDIELRYTPNGTAIAKCGIASTRKWNDNGQTREETMFIDFSIFGKQAEIAQKYLHRGSKVLIEGRLNLEQWTDKNGQKRSKHSIAVESFKMLDGKPQGGQVGGQAYNQGGQVAQPQYQQPAPQQRPVQTPPQQGALPEVDINDSEIPFNGGTR